MESHIWSVKSEEIASLKTFRTEADMESFLMNNPAVIGCFDDEKGSSLFYQQLFTHKGKGGNGFIDLVGITINDKGYELHIFELKNGTIDKKAVEQLKEYLDGWKKPGVVGKSKTEEKVKEYFKERFDESEIKDILDNPRGVLIGTKYDPEAITEASKNKFKAIRIARFTTNKSPEYYILIEDQIGDLVRCQFVWQDFLEKGLIKETDKFINKPGNNIKDIIAKPDFNLPKTKNLLFEDESKKRILEKLEEKKIEEGDKFVKEVINTLKTDQSLGITNATKIVYLSFGGKVNKNYWVPAPLWTHDKKNITLSDLIEQLKKS
jgi:hypothetical protein